MGQFLLPNSWPNTTYPACLHLLFTQSPLQPVWPCAPRPICSARSISALSSLILLMLGLFFLHCTRGPKLAIAEPHSFLTHMGLLGEAQPAAASYFPFSSVWASSSMTHLCCPIPNQPPIPSLFNKSLNSLHELILTCQS